MPTNFLAFYSAVNTKNKHDADGAFIPEAKAFQRYHSIPSENMIAVDCVTLPKPKRREVVKEALAARQTPIDCLAFFGHGWPDGIQFGFTRAHAHALASLLALKCATRLRLAIYACSTAENDVIDSNHKDIGPGTDGSFADTLRDEMTEFGFNGWIDAHKTAGHATFNPYVVRFYCDSEAAGGAWIVAPGSELWKPWRKSLQGDLRFRFPLMSELEIKNLLSLAPV